MNRIIRKTYIFFLNILPAIMVAVGLGACSDDYFNRYGGDGDGSLTDVQLQLDFMPLAESSIESRAAGSTQGTVAPKGDAMSDVNDLCLVVFDGDKFNRVINVDMSSVTISDADRTNDDASNGQLAGESSTRQLKVNVSLPVGTHYIYAVANLTDASATADSYNWLLAQGVETMTRQEFRELRRTWDPSNFRNNSEMTGFFSEGRLPGSSVRSTVSGSEEAVYVKPGASLHCWLRRMASKLTVNFDATKLDDNTTIYIRDIRVHDIAYDCPLLQRNSVATTSRDTPGGLLKDDRNVHVLQIGSGSDPLNWPYLTSGRTNLNSFQNQNQLGHDNSHYALFFYENMQGQGELKYQDAGTNDPDNPGEVTNTNPDGYIDSPNSTDPDDRHYKDAMPCGTYVEVRAYYMSTALGNEGSGEIYYRFMLGANADDNYDVERNHHYKLTLRFNGFANDYDWHVEYIQDEVPITIPNPYYISYGYNESLELPIAIQGEILGDTISATIIRNDWWPSIQWNDIESDQNYHCDRSDVIHPTGDAPAVQTFRKALRDTLMKNPYYSNNPNLLPQALQEGNQTYKEGVSLGFLSLRKPHQTQFGDGVKRGDGARTRIYKYWLGFEEQNGGSLEKTRGGTLGYRRYNLSTKTSYDNDEKDGSFRVVTTNPGGDRPKKTTVYLPLYTRERNMVKDAGYTGQNPYDTEQRRAQVRYSFKVRLGGEIKCVDTLIDIVQVTRIGNPTGIWRRWNNAAPFDVVLKIIYGHDSQEYRSLESHGGWSAEVETGNDWILLNGGKRKIYGENGENIHFTYRPAGTLMDETKVRCGTILVKYHNYTCTHRIFVRQGYWPIQIRNDGVYWHSSNLVSATDEAASPADEGSMFKFGNLDQPIASSNNVYDFDPWVNVTQKSFRNHADTGFDIVGMSGTMKWGKIKSESKPAKGKYKWSADGNRYITFKERKCRLLEVEDIVGLRLDPLVNHAYGVLYDDNARETAVNVVQAFRHEHSDPSTRTYGMRGCFIYNGSDGRHVFLPIGKTGFGHRKAKRPKTRDPQDLPEDEGWAPSNEVGAGVLRYAAGRVTKMDIGGRQNTPFFYDLYRRPGAIYWCNTLADDQKFSMQNDRIALDINYFSYDFAPYGTEPFDGYSSGYGSDACFIRLVEDAN